MGFMTIIPKPQCGTREFYYSCTSDLGNVIKIEEWRNNNNTLAKTTYLINGLPQDTAPAGLDCSECCGGDEVVPPATVCKYYKINNADFDGVANYFPAILTDFTTIVNVSISNEPFAIDVPLNPPNPLIPEPTGLSYSSIANHDFGTPTLIISTNSDPTGHVVRVCGVVLSSSIYE